MKKSVELARMILGGNDRIRQDHRTKALEVLDEETSGVGLVLERPGLMRLEHPEGTWWDVPVEKAVEWLNLRDRNIAMLKSIREELKCDLAVAKLILDVVSGRGTFKVL